MTRKKRKTVFVLGAGFSKAAGIPTQAELLPLIIKKLDRSSKIIQFIKDVYSLDYNNFKNLNSKNVIDLEDIYTPIHQSIIRNEYLKGYSPKELRNIETELNIKISEVIDEALCSSSYVVTFRDILAESKMNAITSDKFSIISLNWDILLDNVLFEDKIYISTRDNHRQYEIVVDYCCHITGINNDNKIMPGLVASTYNKINNKNDPILFIETLQKKYIIFKLIKLHGSLGWGECPSCNRLFFNKKEKIGLQSLKRRLSCRFCGEKVKLNAVMALPSFQKELQKFHFQHIWNQAAIELSEAKKIVFMGYSFPLADFDFRSMVTKHVDTDTEIQVVDLNKDIENSDVGKRYENFFGIDRTRLFGKGVADYIENNLRDEL